MVVELEMKMGGTRIEEQGEGIRRKKKKRGGERRGIWRRV
jgi:hypothetical protein